MKRSRDDYKSRAAQVLFKAGARYAARAAGRYLGYQMRQGGAKRMRKVYRQRTRTRYQRARRDGYRGRITKKVMKKKIRKICSFIKQQEATHIHRYRGAKRCLSAVLKADMCVFPEGGRLTDVESAAANLRFFDPGLNDLVTVNASSGSYHRDIRVSIFRKLTLKNNYQVPVELKIYSCIPNDAFAVSNDPITVFNNGMIDQTVNNASTNPLIYVNDCKQLKDMWSCKMLKSIYLQPGESVVAKSFCRQFNFPFDTVDQHPLGFNKNLGGHCFLVHLHGVLGHDTTVITEQGLLQSGVDAMIDVTYTFKYDAGKDLHDVSYADTTTAFTNNGVVSSRPWADNIGYSQA